MKKQALNVTTTNGTTQIVFGNLVEFEHMPDYLFFVYSDRKQWCVTEFTTGMNIGVSISGTRKAAIAAAEKALKGKTQEEFGEHMEEAIRIIKGHQLPYPVNPPQNTVGRELTESEKARIDKVLKNIKAG